MELTYRRATLEDLVLLTKTRTAVLRAANQLEDQTDMSQVEQGVPGLLSKGPGGREPCRLPGV